jgi:hypothetical protein
MHAFISSRLLLILAAAIALAGSLPSHGSSFCGSCDPGWYWGGVSDGAYRFDSSVPDYVEEATFWADDDWGSFYHDESNPNGTLIKVEPMGPGELGGYDNVNNTLYIAEAVLNDCPDPGCNVLISVIAHEFGHAAGFENIEGGCETSIMSWWRDRNVVIGPSSEDMCWFWDGWEGDGGGGGGGCFPYCEDRQVESLQIDYDTPPRSWREALDRAEFVAVIQLKSLTYEEDSATLPRTHFDADVIELIKDSGGVYQGRAISVTRYGGVREVAGASIVTVERHFAPWTPGQTLLVFLNWFDRTQSFTPFGPHAAFELDLSTNRVSAFAPRGFGGRHDGRAVADLLADVKAAR